MIWKIVYSDSIVVGVSEEEWKAAPDDDVQAVVLFDKVEQVRWSCDGQPIYDRQLWTGEDEYDPFGWGVKYGRLIDDALYAERWREACLR